MIAAIAVSTDGSVGQRWGRAEQVAVAEATTDGILRWDEYGVGWDAAHDEGTEGAHHARVARFLQEHHVDTVVADHMGDGMTRMLGTMCIAVILGAAGDARAQVLEAARQS